MKQNNDYHMNVGGASMILLMVVFAMTVFAALSVRASLHEKRLSEKTRAAVEDYYRMDSEAEEKKIAITNDYFSYLANGGKAADYSIDGYNVENGLISYTVSGDLGSNKLYVTLKLTDSGVSVKKWALDEHEEGDYGEGGEEIWNGIIIIE